MSETILLDPEAITGNAAGELSIATPGSQGAIEVRDDGVDWGDAMIEAIMAQQVVGSLPVDYEIPNRVISMKVKIQAWGETTFAQARSALQAKVAAIQAGRTGWISREMPGVGTVYADLVSAKINLPGDWMQAHRDIQIEATLSFEAIPDFYELEWEEVEFTDVEAGENHWRGVAENIRGDFPKGNRCKVVVEGDADHDQLGLMAAFRCRHYSADPTAACFLQAEDLEPLDLATVVALSGSNNAVLHNNLGTNWTPVLGLRLAGGDYLTHTGTYRLIARVGTLSATPPELRCVFDVGDLINPAENDPVQIPGASNFYLVDLGVLRLDRVPVGDHRWLGQIQGRGAAGGENVYIHTIDLWPTDEYRAEVSVPLSPSQNLNAYTARDEFNQSSGGLSGKTLPSGGTWSGAGDSDDFSIHTTARSARRTAVSDASGVGRYGLASAATAAGVLVQAPVTIDSYGTGFGEHQRIGIVARYGSTGLNLRCLLHVNDEASGQTRELVLLKSGGTAVNTPTATLPELIDGAIYWIRLLVSSAGMFMAWFWKDEANPGDPLLVGYDPDLAAGGALATGQVGIFDQWTGGGAKTRDVLVLQAWPLAADAVIFAGQNLELSTNGATRASADGISGGRLSPFGSHPRLPQSGPEEAHVELMVATSRGDLDQLPDPGLDDVGVQMLYRKTWLTAPGD